MAGREFSKLVTRLRSRTGAALALALLLSVPLSVTEFVKTLHSTKPDFAVYYNAAHLVRDHKSNHLYDGADTGTNPQLRHGVPGTVWTDNADRLGIPEIRLYVYPPTLADALLPLTLLTLKPANTAWWVLDLVALAITAMLLLWLVDYPIASWGCVALTAAFFVFRPDIITLYWGQVTIYLLLLWTAGIVLYCKGRVRSSAVLLALAVAIKLTPVVILLPLLVWKEWRWARWFAGALLVYGSLLCVVNGPATLADFFLHVAPPMSNGIPATFNCSLSGGVEMVGNALRGIDPKQVDFQPVMHSDALLGKLLSVLAALGAFAGIVRIGRPAAVLDRARILALVAVLSLCIAPVSWRHAYPLVVPMLFLLWKDAFDHRKSAAWLAMLVFATLEFGFVIDSVLATLSQGVVFAAIPLIAPVCALFLIFHQLARIEPNRARA